MANYSTLGTVAVNKDFQQRVQYAVTSGARVVYLEGAGVTGHAARLVFALKVLVGNYNLAGVCLAVLTDPTIVAEADTAAPDNGITDAHIQAAIASMWSALAGV